MTLLVKQQVCNDNLKFNIIYLQKLVLSGTFKSNVHIAIFLQRLSDSYRVLKLQQHVLTCEYPHSDTHEEIYTIVHKWQRPAFKKYSFTDHFVN